MVSLSEAEPFFPDKEALILIEKGDRGPQPVGPRVKMLLKMGPSEAAWNMEVRHSGPAWEQGLAWAAQATAAARRPRPRERPSRSSCQAAGRERENRTLI